MAYYDTTWYCNFGNGTSTGYYAVATWATGATIAAGALRRQLTTPTIGNERVFVCIVAGTTNATTEPTWVVTRGAKTTDNTVTWQEVTGIAAVNGDATNTVTWTQAKAIGTPTLGTIIKRNNGASYWICSTAGTLGASEPAWPNDTAGTTQADGTTTWTCLGVVGNFTGGQAPHARLSNVCTSTWFASGNTCYVGDNHAESQTTAININPLAGQGTVGKIICHNHSGSYPPASANLATGASLSTTGASQLTVNLNSGPIYVYGLTFVGGVGQSSFGAGITLGVTNGFGFYDNCVFKTATTSASQTLAFSGVGTMLWNNCQVNFANAAQFVDVGSNTFIWQNSGVVLTSGSSVPTNLIGQSANGRMSNILLEALDLSQVTSVFVAGNASTGNWVVKDCKLNASATFATPGTSGQSIQYIRCDSGATGYKSARYVTEGTETTNTSITLVGGAADANGQAQSRQIATTANSQWVRPFKGEPFAIWNSLTGANVTVTVYGTINAGTLPNNDDIWMDVEYLGSSANPLGTIVNTTKAGILAANAAVASDSSTWNGGGSGAGWSPFKLTTTLGGGIAAWNPSDVVSTWTFSNGNLQATSISGASGIRATAGRSTGKYYFELTGNPWTTSTNLIGMASGSSLINNGRATGHTVGSDGNGTIYLNGTASGNLSGSGPLFCFAVDVGAQLIWIRSGATGSWNATSGTANDPATGTGGINISAVGLPLFPAFTVPSSGATDGVLANFGASAFSGAIPSGFAAGWPSPQPGMAGYIYVRPRVAKPSTTFYLDPKVVLS